MIRRILLISANRCTEPDPVFPLGLGFMTAALRQAGREVLWHDVQAPAEPLEQLLDSFLPDLVGISLRNIDDVLIRRQEVYFDELSQLCETIRQKRRAPVVIGGSGFSIFPERLLEESGADFGIVGEGEEALESLIRELESNRNFASIPGLVYRHGEQIVRQPCEPLSQADSKLLVEFPQTIAAHYLGRGGMLNLQTQRGCPHGCCYCTYPLIEGRKNRRRAPEIVAEEMARLQAAGAKYAFIVDSIFNSSPHHVTEVCESIIRHEVNLKWGCFLRPQGLTSELMTLMARAGLAHAEFGSDSFCDQVLEEYGKGFDFESVARSHDLAHRAGVECCHFLICGGPGETMETLETTYKNSLRLERNVILAVVGMRLYPGTALHHRALKEGRIMPSEDLLAPRYYLADGLEQETVFGKLKEFSKRDPSWVTGDPAPEYRRLVERLRSRGVAGPLWSYFAMIQRIMPSA